MREVEGGRERVLEEGRREGVLKEGRRECWRCFWYWGWGGWGVGEGRRDWKRKNERLNKWLHRRR